MAFGEVPHDNVKFIFSPHSAFLPHSGIYVEKYMCVNDRPQPFQLLSRGMLPKLAAVHSFLAHLSILESSIQKGENKLKAHRDALVLKQKASMLASYPGTNGNR